MTVQRLAGQLIRLACRNLPGPDRAIRCQEWTAEAAAILDDPDTRSLARRQIRTLLFAADHLRGTRRMAGRAYYPVTGWRKFTPLVFPFCAWCVANYGTLWLPLSRPVRLVLVELILGAAMAQQVIRERRHWPPGSKRESDLATARRISIVVYWSILLWFQVPAGLVLGTLPKFAWTMVSALVAVVFLDRWIFTWPSSAEHSLAGQDPQRQEP